MIPRKEVIMEKKKSPIRVSFKQGEEIIEAHIRSKGDMSVYIKDLVKIDMEKTDKK